MGDEIDIFPWAIISGSALEMEVRGDGNFPFFLS
jgi:hypothetical protein